MHLGFKDQRLGALCNSDKRLRQIFGDELAEHVQDILMCLDAAPTLADISSAPPLLRRCIYDGDPPVYAVGPTGRGQLMFTPADKFDADELVDRVTIQDIQGSN